MLTKNCGDFSADDFKLQGKMGRVHDWTRTRVGGQGRDGYGERRGKRIEEGRQRIERRAQRAGGREGIAARGSGQGGRGGG